MGRKNKRRERISQREREMKGRWKGEYGGKGVEKIKVRQKER